MLRLHDLSSRSFSTKQPFLTCLHEEKKKDNYNYRYLETGCELSISDYLCTSLYDTYVFSYCRMSVKSTIDLESSVDFRGVPCVVSLKMRIKSGLQSRILR